MVQRQPIGVFDSGVGGLTVVRALMERLPNEDIIYFGDTARVPYGIKSRHTIEVYTEQITAFMLEHDVKAIVIACNTIASVAGNIVRDMVGNMPVLDVIAAGSDVALRVSRNGHIGVIATSTTVNSNAYARSIHSRKRDVRVYSQACPLLVPLVEEGWLDHEVTRLTVQEYLKPLLAEDIDTLVLGCTHYPLLKPLFRKQLPELVLVDSAVATSEMVAHALQEKKLLNPDHKLADYRFYVSDIPLRFQTIGERFLGRSLEKLEMISLG